MVSGQRPWVADRHDLPAPTPAEFPPLGGVSGASAIHVISGANRGRDSARPCDLILDRPHMPPPMATTTMAGTVTPSASDKASASRKAVKRRVVASPLADVRARPGMAAAVPSRPEHKPDRHPLARLHPSVKVRVTSFGFTPFGLLCLSPLTFTGRIERARLGRIGG